MLCLLNMASLFLFYFQSPQGKCQFFSPATFARITDCLIYKGPERSKRPSWKCQQDSHVEIPSRHSENISESWKRSRGWTCWFESHSLSGNRQSASEELIPLLRTIWSPFRFYKIISITQQGLWDPPSWPPLFFLPGHLPLSPPHTCISNHRGVWTTGEHTCCYPSFLKLFILLKSAQILLLESLSSEFGL